MDSKPTIRKATVADIPHLTFFRLEAQDGINEALFENLDTSVDEIIEREMTDLESIESYDNFWVIEVEGEISGGIQMFPFDFFDDQEYNPIIPKDRLYIEEPFEEIPAPGTYYVHALTVYPKHTRKGIASNLVSHAKTIARKNGYQELSLYCLAENRGAVSLYEKHGFKTIGKRPMPKHQKIKHGGNILLMVSSTRNENQAI